MDQLPSNSHRNQREPEKKQIERVVRGQVTTRKPSVGRRLKEAFFAGHADAVGEFVFWDVFIPSTKDIIADMGVSFVDRLLFGESRSARGRSALGRSIGTYGNQTNYNGISRGPASPLGDRREPNLGTMSARGRANFDFQELVIPTRVEAEAVIDGLFNTIEKYNAATVADLYEMCGVTGSYTDDKYGWADIRGAGIIRVHNGFVLNLPRPEPLD